MTIQDIMAAEDYEQFFNNSAKEESDYRTLTLSRCNIMNNKEEEIPRAIEQSLEGLHRVSEIVQAISDAVGDDPDSKGKLRISTRREDDWAEILISDTGTGIPEDIRAKIFDPFFTTKKRVWEPDRD